ncbi:TPR repeat-containing protein [Caballeronia peredens]|nr:TPR repeat-containing protein [Caballeronia peredens]
MQELIEAPVDLFASAMAEFQAGNRARAAQVCSQILAKKRSHSGANHLLGVVRLLDGDVPGAESYIRASLALAPSAEAESDLSLALRRLNRLDEAEAALRRALALAPRFTLARNALGLLLAEQGNIAGAEAEYRAALAVDPNAPEPQFNLGKVLAKTGRRAEALAAFERVVVLRPSWAEAHNSLGSTLAEMNRRTEAEAAFRRALEHRPRLAEALCNLGTLLFDSNRFSEAEPVLRAALDVDSRFASAAYILGQTLNRLDRNDEAIEAYHRASELSPDDVGTLNLLGALLGECGRFEEAEAPLRRAVELDPRHVPARANLGCLLLDLQKPAEAEVQLRAALEVAPDYWIATYNLGNLLRNARRLDEAEAVARRALELKPDFDGAYVGLANVLLAKASGDISETLKLYRRAIELDPDCLIAHANLSYALTFVSEDGSEVFEESRRFAQHFEPKYLAREVVHSNDRSPARRLRVGYVSPDFRNHCQALFMRPLMKHHDHAAVEVYCYSSVATPDHVTRELMTYADVWRDVHKLDDDQLAAQIMADQIDVLVDLTMHMSNARPLLFPRRPAPVQVAWLAYPGTTGLSSIGYRFTDPWLDPLGDPQADGRYSEKSIRLSDTFWCYEPLDGDIEVSSLPADTSGHVTFGCLNNPCKVTDLTIDLWARVMRRVTGSRLLLLLANGSAREIVSAKFEQRGIERNRLTFMEYQQRPQYLRTYHQIDIVLDTFPYNGHTTSLDSLWMGVPVATVIGNTPPARAGYSLLSNLDLSDMAAPDGEAFVETAVTLAMDKPRLRRLRAELRQRMQASALMDGARFAKAIEHGIRAAWNDWLDTQ